MFWGIVPEGRYFGILNNNSVSTYHGRYLRYDICDEKPTIHYTDYDGFCNLADAEIFTPIIEDLLRMIPVVDRMKYNY